MNLAFYIGIAAVFNPRAPVHNPAPNGHRASERVTWPEGERSIIRGEIEGGTSWLRRPLRRMPSGPISGRR